MSKIEISFPVDLEASAAFWVERYEWEAMTPEQRQQRIDAHLDDLQRQSDRGALICDGGALSVVFGPSPNADRAGVYDPEAEG